MNRNDDAATSSSSIDERNLLASIGTSIQLQTEYESAVIRQATHKDIPALTGIGFPDLSSLIPRNGASTYITHVLATLSKIRHQMQSMSVSEENTPEAHLIQMKYQILLSFLSNHTHVSMEDIRHDDSQEILSEKKRKRNLLYQTSLQSMNKNNNHGEATQQDETSSLKSNGKNLKSIHPPTTIPTSGPQALEYIKRHFATEYDDSIPILSTAQSASFGKQAIDSRNESIRISRQKTLTQSRKLMDMKRTMTEAAGEEYIDPVGLWNKREARREKRRLKKEESKQQRLKEEVEEGEEKEGEFVLEEDHVIVPVKSLTKKSLGKDKGSGKRRETSQTTEQISIPQSMVYCSICTRSIGVPMKDDIATIDLDEFLCRHMSTCRGTINNLRSSRSDRQRRRVSWENAVTYNSNPEDSNLTGGECTNGADHSDDKIIKLNQQIEDEPIFEREIAIDDFDEDNYEDRVDEWIEVTLKQMKIAMLKDGDEENSMPVIFPGGLFVPSWVYKKLFSYQRTGLRWMWELFQQSAGGIVGDEMVSTVNTFSLSCH